MADEAKAAPPAKVKAQISFCPVMGVYHYKQADGQEFLFDTPRLVADLDAMMASGEEGERRAHFMSLLTVFARRYSHKVVSFDECGSVDLSELEKPEQFGDDSPGTDKPQG